MAAVERFEMRANFEGLIQLLARNLYPEPDVFVRELIQNAHDSIRLRQQEHEALRGRIDVEVRPADSAIVFRDNGLGMDRGDIKDFLSVIGSTGTGTARQRLQAADRSAAQELIGQFGIGLLSAFVVAERVRVRTRKQGSDETLEWENRGTTDCELRTVHAACEPGTEITVVVSDTSGFMLDCEFLSGVIVRYCDFIPFPIRVNGSEPVNAMEAPWDRTHWPSQAEKEAAYRLFLHHRYPDVPVDVIPVEIDGPFRARGALYISDRRVPDFDTPGVVDVFVRRMFVRSGDTEFLPPWAKFIRGVIDSPDLQPTAARDNVHRDDEAFEFLRGRLGELVVERLIYLATNEPRRFEEINHWHHYHLKGMALLHDEFFELVADLLLFETNAGLKSLRECLVSSQHKLGTASRTPLYYFAHRESAEQFYRLANARDWVVINAGHLFEEELVEKYAGWKGAEVQLVRLDSSTDSGFFQPPSEALRDRCRQLELNVERALRRAKLTRVSVSVRRFQPSSLPAVILSDAESEAELKLVRLIRQPWFMESLGDVAREALKQGKRRPLHIVLNEEHGLVRQLIDIEGASTDLHDILIVLCLSALLYSPNLLTDDVAEVAHHHLVELLGAHFDYRWRQEEFRASWGGLGLDPQETVN